MPVRVDDLEGYLDQVTRSVQGILGPSLVGLYLHGSAALGSFVAGTSDIDLLAVVGDLPPAAALASLGEALHPDVISHPSPLDLHVVTGASLNALEPRWEAWYSSHPVWGEFRIVLQATDDLDLFLVFEVCRRQGRALIGPPAARVFPAIPLPSLLKAADANLAAWQAFERFWLPEEAVLTACRAWYLAERGVVVGKREAGEWARSQRGASLVIADALARREGAAVQVPEEKARLLLEEVRERIREKAQLMAGGGSSRAGHR